MTSRDPDQIEYISFATWETVYGEITVGGNVRDEDIGLVIISSFSLFSIGSTFRSPFRQRQTSIVLEYRSFGIFCGTGTVFFQS